MEGVLGEGQAEQLHAQSRRTAVKLAERSTVQGLGTHSRAPLVPSL